MPNCADGSGLSSRKSSRTGSTSGMPMTGSSAYGHTTVSGPFGSMPNSRRSSAGSRPGSRRGSIFLNPQDSLDSNNGYISASSLAAAVGQQPISALTMGGVPAGVPAGVLGVAGNPDDPNGSLTAGQTLLQSIGAGVVGAASSFSTITPPRYRKTFLRPYQHF